jgi:CRISPR-associated protein Cas5/DevS
MLYLYVEAPFAVFRSFSAGSFRPTAPFITYSAAYGLLLNLAGIEMREDDGKSVMTRIKCGLPRMKLALGEVEPAREHQIYQQLHNYPVGNQGKETAHRTKGGKYNIVPARRSFLANLKACLGVDAGQALESAILDGLNGKGGRRYGLPFLGDNNFLPNRIEVNETPRPARWLTPITGEHGPVEPMRLTVTIDRSDMANTSALLFWRADRVTDAIPEQAWVELGYG